MLRMWLPNNPERYDMIDGKVTMDFIRHSTNKLSLDRIDESKPHFLSLQHPFANIRIVPLKLNTPSSLIQLYGDDTRAKIKELVLDHRDIDIDMEAQISAYKKLPKRTSIIYCMYRHCIYNGEHRHQNINAPIPQTPSFEQFQERVFEMLRRQHGKSAVAPFIFNYNFDGPKQFQISVDRIDPTNINYWDWSNLQLVALLSLIHI